MDQRSKVNGKAVKVLEENIGNYLHDFKIGNAFLNTKAQTMKKETDKIDFIKWITFIYQNTFLREWKNNTQNKKRKIWNNYWQRSYIQNI